MITLTLGRFKKTEILTFVYLFLDPRVLANQSLSDYDGYQMGGGLQHTYINRLYFSTTAFISFSIE